MKSFVISNLDYSVVVKDGLNEIVLNGASYKGGVVNQRGITEITDQSTLDKIKDNWFVKTFIDEGRITITEKTPFEFEKEKTAEDLITTKKERDSLKDEANKLQEENEALRKKLKSLESKRLKGEEF